VRERERKRKRKREREREREFHLSYVEGAASEELKNGRDTFCRKCRFCIPHNLLDGGAL
jgi:hypothetical protein